MKTSPYNYNIFFDFIESYLPSGFQNINPDDPIMQHLEEAMQTYDQFFSVMELEQIKILFTSKRSMQILGVNPSELSPAHFLSAMHPEDRNRFKWAVTQKLKIEIGFFMAKRGRALLSYSGRYQNSSGDFVQLLRQNYIFYSAVPKPTVFSLQIVTNIDWHKFNKKCFHRYGGTNISLFKFPDEELLKIGSQYTKRELEVIKLIEMGLSSKQIAEKLFLSLHTVSTHRSNILDKSGKTSLSELIYELKEQGLL